MYEKIIKYILYVIYNAYICTVDNIYIEYIYHSRLRQGI